MAIAEPAELVIESAAANFEQAARDIAGRVHGNSEIDVVHVVDPRESLEGALLATMNAVTSVAVTLPAVNFRQWVIALVGDDWDDDELHLLDTAGENLPGSGLFVLGRSSEARGLLTERDEIAMASDLAFVLITSDLRRGIGISAHWTAGVSAVMYRRRLLIAALAAYFAGVMLDETLLAPIPATQPFGAKGLRWPGQAALGSDRHVELLSRGPLGGSVLSDLAVSEEIFEDTPYEFLSDALQSYFEQLTAGKLARLKEQIDRNLNEHLTETQSALQGATVAILRESLNFESTDDFLRNIDAGLAELVQVLVVKHNAAERALPDPEEIRAELENAIENLPYSAAVAVRGAGFAGVGVCGYLVAIGFLSAPTVLAPLGVGVGALSSVGVYGWYRTRVTRVGDLRRSFLRAVERRLQSEAELYVLKRAVDELTALREYVISGPDGPRARLHKLRDQVGLLRATYQSRADNRAWGHLFPTAYSVFVPDPHAVPTASLAQQFPLQDRDRLQDALLRAILPTTEIVPIEPDEADAVIVDVVGSQVENRLWRDLEDLMSDAPMTSEQIENVLSVKMSPILRRRNFIHGQDEVRRFLFTGARTAESIEQALASKVDFDGGREHAAPDSIALVALRDATVVVQTRDGDADG